MPCPTDAPTREPRRGRVLAFKRQTLISPDGDLSAFAGPVVAVYPVDGGFVVEAAEERFRLEVDEDGWTLAPLSA